MSSVSSDKSAPQDVQQRQHADQEAAKPAPPAAFDPPDGGRAAWQTVAAGWLCQFCSFGFINA